ncbi:TonB-dependent receptor [uncultured Duncaniella sp.]|uniref:TonB-dependent receptor n=1 Tax=uncultured Duncaniella sp. TaxID=2768039 RepID=UPI0025E41734|nr:TonB-dependent receptor [uncultured Duncaniella sp.]
MNTKIALITLALAATPFAAFSQGLHKEINVDQKIDPLKRDASRINVLPTLQLPSIGNNGLPFSDRVVTSSIPKDFQVLAPLAYGDKLYISPYRGYVALGLGTPLFNSALSAGYRILDSDKTRLSLWGEYNGDIYTTKTSVPHLAMEGASSEIKNYWRDHSATVGADFHTLVGKTSALNAGLVYNYAYHTNPLEFSTFGQNISRVNGQVGFTSNGEGIRYSAALHYGHFGFYHSTLARTGYAIPEAYPEKGVRQNLFGFSGLISLPFGESSSIGLDVDADFLRSTPHIHPLYPYLAPTDISGKASSTSGLVSLTPHYDFTSGTVKVGLGAQIDISSNTDKTFHIAPEVSFAWTPSQILGFEVKAHGGSRLNSLSELYDVTPYLAPSMAYTQSHIPLALDARLTFGPFFGAYIEAFGGYAKASDWLMPVITSSYPGEGIFGATNLSAWHGGIAVGYDYRDAVSARVSYETAPHSYDNAFYEWRDRARHVLNAELSVRPVRPLLVTLGWEFRAGRRAYSLFPETVSDLGTIYTPVAHSLGVVSNLSLGATYTVSDPLSVFVRCENLLDRRFDYIGGRPSQGINFMLGATLKF